MLCYPLHYTFVSWEIWARLASGVTIQAAVPCFRVMLSARSFVCVLRCAQLLPPSIAQHPGRQTPMISNNSSAVLIGMLCSAH